VSHGIALMTAEAKIVLSNAKQSLIRPLVFRHTLEPVYVGLTSRHILWESAQTTVLLGVAVDPRD